MHVIFDVLLTINLSKEVSVFVPPTLTDIGYGPTVHRVTGTTCISMVPDSAHERHTRPPYALLRRFLLPPGQEDCQMLNIRKKSHPERVQGS